MFIFNSPKHLKITFKWTPVKDTHPSDVSAAQLLCLTQSCSQLPRKPAATIYSQNNLSTSYLILVSF